MECCVLSVECGVSLKYGARVSRPHHKQLNARSARFLVWIKRRLPALYGSVDYKKTALLISHAHQDHYGLISFLNKKIPVYIGKAAHALIELSAVFAGKEKVIEKPRYFESYKPFTFGDMEITPYIMDHAAFDAYAFLVRAEGKSLIYTGDFRAHGRKWRVFWKFLHIAPKNVDWLLMEGTSLSRKRQKFQTEEQLEEQFVKTFRESSGIKLVYVSGQNIDRLVRIFRSCIRSVKIFVIDFYIATVLSELAALGYGVPRPSPDFSNIRVFFPDRLRRRIEKSGRKDIIERFAECKITPKEINEKAANIVMTVRAIMDYEINRIQNLSGGNLIYSMWEGYRETPSTENFLENIVKRGAAITTIHTSGHADYYTLREMINAVNPIELVPIHTTEGDRYQAEFPSAKVRRVRNGELVEKKSDIQEKAKELTLFDHCEEIGKAHKKTGFMSDSGFDDFTAGIKPHLEVVCKKLQVTELHAVLFSDLLNIFDGDETRFRYFVEFVGCKQIKLLKCKRRFIHTRKRTKRAFNLFMMRARRPRSILQTNSTLHTQHSTLHSRRVDKTTLTLKYLDEFRALEEKCLIVLNNNVFDRSYGQKISFDITLDVLDSLKKNELPKNLFQNLTIADFFDQVEKLFRDYAVPRANYYKARRTMSILLNGNMHLMLVKKIKAYCLSEDDELTVLYFCHCYIDFGEDEVELNNLRTLSDHFRTMKQQLQSGNHVLQQKKILKYVNNGGFADTEIYSLIDTAKEEILSEVEDQLASKTVQGLKTADNITVKKLFYPEKTARKVAELSELLKEENFSSVHRRLSMDGMRTGFACLFLGGPGTGKTETVYQIARLTGRGIMQVDISATKSMWFGQCEKIIKEVFNRYRKAVKKLSITPILLLNEADAVISKRRELGETSDAATQTGNAIQNIILQEIENLDGILIATTNLAINMDKAFERRFIYKIEFEKSNPDTRKFIWWALIPALPGMKLTLCPQNLTFPADKLKTSRAGGPSRK